MVSDSRVRTIVDRFTPPKKLLKAAIQVCTSRAPHMWVVSYGGSNQRTVGVVFELVRCPVYGMGLLKRVYDFHSAVRVRENAPVIAGPCNCRCALQPVLLALRPLDLWTPLHSMTLSSRFGAATRHWPSTCLPPYPSRW